MELILLYINLFFPIFSNLIGTSLGSILLILLILTGSVLIIIREGKILINRFVIGISLFYIFMIFLSIFFNFEVVIFEDFYELQRPLLCILAVTIGYRYSFKTPKKIFLKRIKEIGYIFILINIYKILNPESIFFQLYQRERLARQTRISGTFISPYDYAYFLIFYFYLYLEEYFKLKKKKYLLLSVLVAFSIIFTQSRSQLITYVFSLFIYFLFKISRKDTRRSIVNFFLRGVTGVMILVFILIEKIKIKLSYLYYGLKNIYERGITGDPSSQIRYNQILLAIEEFKFFGNSPNKISELLFENQYILYLYRYGALGIIYNIVLISYLIKISYLLLKEKESDSFIVSYSIFCFSLPIAFLANNIVDQLRINYFFYFMLGVIIFRRNNRNK